MGWEIGLLLIGIMGAAGFGWYLYRRSMENKSEDTNQASDSEENVDEYEDLLLTGLMLNEIYNEDEDQSSSDDIDADDAELMDDGGFDDSGGFE